MKRYMEGTVRFIRQGPARGVSIQCTTMHNFVLCDDCQRMIPRREYPEHCANAHPYKVLHIPECPSCKVYWGGHHGRAYTVAAGEIGGECGNVLECDTCTNLLTPTEYAGCF